MTTVTIKDVAAKAGVSVATASRVLSGGLNTSAASRKAVTEAAEALHYYPNIAARSLRSLRTHTVGLLVSDIRNPYFSELAYAAQMALMDRGYCTLLGNASEQEALQDRYLTSLRQQQVDGLIVAPQGRGSDLLVRLSKQGLPMVFVDRTLPQPVVPSVDSDPVPGLVAALDALAELGHRRVGFVGGPQSSSTGRERLRDFKRFAQLRFPHAHTAVGGYDQQRCTRAVNQLLSQGCTALVFSYSPNALTGIAMLRDRGLAIGSDVSVVSFDEVPYFELNTPAISYISQGVSEMGRLAVDMLMDLFEGTTPTSRRLPTEFCPRDSIGAAPGGKL